VSCDGERDRGGRDPDGRGSTALCRVGHDGRPWRDGTVPHPPEHRQGTLPPARGGLGARRDTARLRQGPASRAPAAGGRRPRGRSERQAGAFREDLAAGRRAGLRVARAGGRGRGALRRQADLHRTPQRAGREGVRGPRLPDAAAQEPDRLPPGGLRARRYRRREAAGRAGRGWLPRGGEGRGDRARGRHRIRALLAEGRRGGPLRDLLQDAARSHTWRGNALGSGAGRRRCGGRHEDDTDPREHR